MSIRQSFELKIDINQSSPIPIYIQLADQLRARIDDGTWPPGTRLPSEHALSQKFLISRGTVRQAMQILTNDGIVERAQGKGTFVSDRMANPGTLLCGAMLPYTHDALTLDILAGIERAVRAEGYHVVFSPVGERNLNPYDIDLIRAKGVSGLIIFPPSNTEFDQTIAGLQHEGLPLVLVDRYLPGLNTDYVVADNFDGGIQATQHLIKLGHKSIGFITPSGLQTTSVRDRYQGYRHALASHDIHYLAEWLLWYQDLMQPDAELAALIAYLESPQRPTAIFAITDLLAIRVLEAARRIGLKVPEDVAIVGFDNISQASQVSVPLTTIAQPRIEIGSRAGEILLARINGSTESPRQITLPVHLVVRESCGANR